MTEIVAPFKTQWRKISSRTEDRDIERSDRSDGGRKMRQGTHYRKRGHNRFRRNRGALSKIINVTPSENGTSEN